MSSCDRITKSSGNRNRSQHHFLSLIHCILNSTKALVNTVNPDGGKFWAILRFIKSKNMIARKNHFSDAEFTTTTYVEDSEVSTFDFKVHQWAPLKC